MIREMIQRMRLRTLAMQVAGNAVLALAFAAWLQIPDSHAWEFALSVIFALVMIASLLLLHAATMRCLRGETTIRLWLGVLLLAGWIAVWYGLVHLVLPLETNLEVRSGYWNSQMSAYWRNWFTYERLVAWQQDVITVIFWWLLPSLLLPLIMETVSRGVKGAQWQAAVRVYKRWELWVSVGVAAWLGLWLTDKLVDWHPTYTVHGELVSVVLRTLLVYLLDVLLYWVVLVVVATRLSRQSSRGNTAAEPAANTPEAEASH